MSVISMEGLTKIYRGKRGRQVEALKDLSLAIGQGEVFGFLGPNGAGKSTTIKILAGMITASAGSATICDVPISMPDARRKLGYLPENPAFPDRITPLEYLAFVGRMFGMENDMLQKEIGRILTRLDLEGAANRPVRQFSKGMVQRLGLAQALLHDPEVYILDEPMSGLDPIGRALVKDIIRELQQRGKTIFFSTHITSDVEIICDRVGILASGVLQAVHDVETLMLSEISGYVVHLKKGLGPSLNGYSVREGAGTMEVQVPRDRYQEFMEICFSCRAEIELIEPQRKSLEAYFLDIVGRGDK